MNHQLCTRQSTGDRQRALAPRKPHLALRLRWLRGVMPFCRWAPNLLLPRMTGYSRAAAITPATRAKMARIKRAHA